MPSGTPSEPVPQAPSDASEWRLPDTVSMRREPFGALLYDHVSRRLAIVKSAELRHLIELLDGGRPFDAALVEAGIDPGQRGRYRGALDALVNRGVLSCAGSA